MRDWLDKNRADDRSTTDGISRQNKIMYNSNLFFAYKGNKCANCGKNIQDAIDRWGKATGLFDLNHVNPDAKSPDYKNLMRRKKLSVEQLDELDKCCLMCKECHSALHQQNLVVGVEMVIDFGDGVRFKKTLDACQVLVDRQEAKVVYFTDELYKILFCKLYLGSKMLGYTTVHDLDQDNFLNILIQKTREQKILSLKSMCDQPVLDVVRLDEEKYKIDWNPGFPLIKFELPLTKDFGIHIRNGAMVTDDFVRTEGISCSAVVFYDGTKS